MNAILGKTLKYKCFSTHLHANGLKCRERARVRFQNVSTNVFNFRPFPCLNVELLSVIILNIDRTQTYEQ